MTTSIPRMGGGDPGGVPPWLKALVVQRMEDLGGRYAADVSVKGDSEYERRVDYLRYETGRGPLGAFKGSFSAYSVISCPEDLERKSVFMTEKNYFVMTSGTFREVRDRLPEGFGVLLAVPRSCSVELEIRFPSEPDGRSAWKLVTAVPVEVRECSRPRRKLLQAMRRAEREERKGWE